jgi:hypothetical protein
LVVIGRLPRTGRGFSDLPPVYAQPLIGVVIVFWYTSPSKSTPKAAGSEGCQLIRPGCAPLMPSGINNFATAHRCARKHLAETILTSRSALEGERKQVTVLFADVKGSTALAEQVDPEKWHGILDRFFRILSDGVHRFEGTVNQYTGDGIMALFGARSRTRTIRSARVTRRSTRTTPCANMPTRCGCGTVSRSVCASASTRECWRWCDAHRCGETLGTRQDVLQPGAGSRQVLQGGANDAR